MTLWEKYGLSNLSQKTSACIAHDLVCFFLQCHPVEQKQYLQGNLHYYTVLSEAENYFCVKKITSETTIEEDQDGRRINENDC